MSHVTWHCRVRSVMPLLTIHFSELISSNWSQMSPKVSFYTSLHSWFRLSSSWPREHKMASGSTGYESVWCKPDKGLLNYLHHKVAYIFMKLCEYSWLNCRAAFWNSAAHVCHFNTVIMWSIYCNYKETFCLLWKLKLWPSSGIQLFLHYKWLNYYSSFALWAVHSVNTHTAKYS